MDTMFRKVCIVCMEGNYQVCGMHSYGPRVVRRDGHSVLCCLGEVHMAPTTTGDKGNTTGGRKHNYNTGRPGQVLLEVEQLPDEHRVCAGQPEAGRRLRGRDALVRGRAAHRGAQGHPLRLQRLLQRCLQGEPIILRAF